MAEGRIKWYSHHLGHGFIVCEDPFGEVFMRSASCVARGHNGLRSDCDPQSLDTGDKVSFEVVDAPQGKEARTVSKVS
jgi:cold shock CspA family protein